MSEFHVETVRVQNVRKHPNADTLDIAEANGYPVIFKSGEYKEGDLAIYVPENAIVPKSLPYFDFLGDKRRIKAKKLRGIYSEGLLAPISLLNDIPEDPGWDVGPQLGILKAEEPEENANTAGDSEKDPGFIPVYTDIEPFRKYAKKVFVSGERLIVTEKIHGANCRFVWYEDRLWVGSHRTFKVFDERNLWWRVVKEYGLEGKLKTIPGVVLYGEVYGQVQNLKYGCKAGEIRFGAFDAFQLGPNNPKHGSYLDFDEFTKLCRGLDVPTVPTRDEIIWDDTQAETLIEKANGDSVIAEHMMEGFVIKPLQERWDDRVGRVILKLVSERYKLSK